MSINSTFLGISVRPKRQTEACFRSVSKDLNGRIEFTPEQTYRCTKKMCASARQTSKIDLIVSTNDPCNGIVKLDGAITFSMKHFHVAGATRRRALHTATFTWKSAIGLIEGEARGFTNIGTHRAPAFEPTQTCWEPGTLEGQLSGHVSQAVAPKYEDVLVVADYRLRWDIGAAGPTNATGTLEGVLIEPCQEPTLPTCVPDTCIDFSAMAQGPGPNPRVESDVSFLASLSNGSQPAETLIRSYGTFSGLEILKTLLVTFPHPVQCVEADLVHFTGAPPVLRAFDSNGTLLSSDQHIGGQGVVDTLEAKSGMIATVEIEAPQNETLLLKLCWGS